jgi:hypothetical protein
MAPQKISVFRTTWIIDELIMYGAIVYKKTVVSF